MEHDEDQDDHQTLLVRVQEEMDLVEQDDEVKMEIQEDEILSRYEEIENEKERSSPLSFHSCISKRYV